MSDDKAFFEQVKAQLAADEARRAGEAAEASEYFKAFSDSLESEDLTGVLIRGHLYVENEMNKFLRNVFPRFDESKIVEFEFAVKLKFLYASGLLSLEQRNAIKTLNQLRNEIAHMPKPGIIPVVTPEMVNRLWDAIGGELQAAFSGIYSRTENTADNLRQIIMDIVIAVHILAGFNSENTIRDIVRYNTTGEKVQERIDAAHKASESDAAHLREVKTAILNLPYLDRDNLREWMVEVFHY